MPFTSKELFSNEDREHLADMKETERLAKKAKKPKLSEVGLAEARFSKRT